jgi:putative copper resistance protein D
VDDPLIYVRAIQFASTLTVAGAVFFVPFVAEPAFRSDGVGARTPAAVYRALRWIAWLGLFLTVLSGAAWLVLVAQSMSGSAMGDIFAEGILWTVLAHTVFGHAWLLRLVLACVLGAMFVPFFSARNGTSFAVKAVVVVVAAGLAGTLAFAGHAAAGPGIGGFVHLAGDILHLIAAAAWLGMLVPLALVLSSARHDAAAVGFARTATMRFSNCGIASVATLLVTGAINTLNLVGSVSALTGTDYGRLLLLKVALFFGMVAIAVVNRVWLAPRLEANRGALRSLWRNTVVEVAAGAAVLAVVAALGVTPPAADEALMPQAAPHHSH